MYGVLLLPALVMNVSGAIPRAVEAHRGMYILRGVPDAECIEAMKRARITHVICLCRDGDAGFEPDKEGRALAAADIAFARVSLSRSPTRDDFELFRMIRNGLGRDARVLVHCTDGNRAAVVAVAWLAVEGLVPRGEAVALARRAGMIHPESEAALRAYIGI